MPSHLRLIKDTFPLYVIYNYKQKHMGLEASRSITHIVQKQTYRIDMEVKVVHNPGNKILKKKDAEMEYEGSVRIAIADKGFTTSGMMEPGEDFTDMLNRLTKLSVFKLSDNLYPSKRVQQVKFKTIAEKKK